MISIQNKVFDISNNYYRYLMNLENVNGVGFGYKYVNDIDTKEPCIHVFVEKKISSSNLSKNNIIPKTYMGIKTDVIEIGVVKELGNYDPFAKVRPLEGGYLIGAGDALGTLGCIVSSNFDFTSSSDSDSDDSDGEYGDTDIPEKPLEKHYYILSNNHVMTDNQTLPIGSPIYQPGSEDYPHDYIVARLSTFIPLKPKENDRGPVNYMDCALAKISKPGDISNRLGGIGKIKGSDKPQLGDFVQKAGAFTGVTFGSVLSLNVTQEVQKQSGKIILYQRQNIAFLNAEPGDSGSVLVNDFEKVIGLSFAGSKTDAGLPVVVFTKIEDVLGIFGVELYF